MKTLIEGKKYKVRKYRKCSICNKKIKCFIDDNTTLDECDPYESLEIWNASDKDSFIYCEECYNNPHCPECGSYTSTINDHLFWCSECEATFNEVTKDLIRFSTK